MSGGWPQFFARARARPTIAPNFQFASDAYATDINALTTYTGNNLDENKVCAGSNQRSDALYVYSDACAQKKKHLYRPTTGTQTLAQTSSAIVSLYMKYYSQIYCSPRAIGNGNQKSDTAIIGLRRIASDSVISFQKWLTTVCVVARRDCKSHSSPASSIQQQARSWVERLRTARVAHACSHSNVAIKMVEFPAPRQYWPLKKLSHNSYRVIFSV